MGYGTDGLTFRTLRDANKARLPQFKNRRGEPAHSEPDGSDWKLSAWCNAVTGELGELANLIKKIERGDMTLDEARQDVADELADVVTYLDILAFRCGVDLGSATMSKFNRVSERVGSDVWVDAEDWHRKQPSLHQPSVTVNTKMDTYITQERGNFGPLKT
jgi:NTP pyrophosphatase (non-canonical NTP hydrolase)